MEYIIFTPKIGAVEVEGSQLDLVYTTGVVYTVLHMHGPGRTFQAALLSPCVREVNLPFRVVMDTSSV